MAEPAAGPNAVPLRSTASVSVSLGLITRMITTNITSFQRGIIFLMAEWSGQAKWAYKQLVDFLAQSRTPSEHLTCIDVDREQGVYDLPEFSGKIHGYGEAAAVKDGRIVFVTTLGKDKSQTHERCAELLRF